MDITSQLSLLPDRASVDDLKSLFPLHGLNRSDDHPEKVLWWLALAYYDRVEELPLQNNSRA